MYKILKQPSGKYTLWSTIVDDFVMLDADTNDLIVFLRKGELKGDIEGYINKIVKILEDGGKPYGDETQSWQYQMAWMTSFHGREHLDDFIKKYLRHKEDYEFVDDENSEFNMALKQLNK